VRLAPALYIAKKEARHLLMGREALLWTFVMPILFFWFIGTVTAGFGSTPGGPSRTALALEAPGHAGFLVDRVAGRLDALGFEVSRAPATPDPSAARLVLPPGFTKRVLEGRRTTVSWTPAANGHGEGQYDAVRLQRALYSVLADVIVAAPDGESPDAQALAKVDAAPRPILVEQRSAGRRRTPPSGFDQAVPGILVMFTLMVLLTSGGVLLVVERRRGLLRRLASAPISRGEVVAGKWAGRLVLGLVQVGFALLAGTLLFGMRWGPDVPMVLVVLLAWASLCASLGLLIGTIAPTEGQAVAVGVLVASVLAALGGCWWPIEITPRWMQSLASVLPTGWAMDALHRLVNFRLGAASALGDVALLVAAALVVGWVATRRFRYA
jgi:ABC-type multidrug transport system permease subunit